MGEPSRLDEPFAAAALDHERPIVAQFDDGPLGGREHVFFRARARHSCRVHRGTLRRVLRTRPRYATYEITEVWWDDELQHGAYRFVGYRAERADDLEAAVFPG
jgi:hypothetical protein